MTLHSEIFSSRDALVQFANGKKARANIKMPIPRDLTDEQAITLDDGTNPATEFRIDADGGGVGGGAVSIDVSAVGDEDKAALATAVASAITGVGAGLAITATAAGESVHLLNDANGAAGNTDIVQGVGGTGLSALPVVFGGDTKMSQGASAITSTDIIRIMENKGLWLLFWVT